MGKGKVQLRYKAGTVGRGQGLWGMGAGFVRQGVKLERPGARLWSAG